MSNKGAQQRPARLAGRKLAEGTFETVDFAARREKRRRQRDLARAARKKQR